MKVRLLTWNCWREGGGSGDSGSVKEVDGRRQGCKGNSWEKEREEKWLFW